VPGPRHEDTISFSSKNREESGHSLHGPCRSGLDLRDRLIWVRRIGNEPSPPGVHEQVELLEHRLSYQDLVTEYQGFLESVSPVDLDDERLCHADSLRASIRVLGHPLTSNAETETSGDLRRDDHANCAGVDECVRLVGPDLFWRQHAPSDQSLVDRVRQPDCDPNLAQA
jgi:hypothetical protein